MNLEIKRKWVEALRSGNYKQAAMCLRNIYGGYCCLGVLCDVYDSSKWSVHEGAGHVYAYLNDADASYPPKKVLEDIGLEKHECVKLGGMNDAEHMNFYEIADWIEKNL